LNDALIFNTSGTAPFQTTATPATVMNHHTLGYRYDTEAQASLGTLKFAAAHLQVLYGIVNDAPGVVAIGPGDPWTQLSPGARDHLIGSAVNELAAQIGNANTRSQLQTAVAGLTAAANTKARATSS
jgi:hypothetical protein